MSLKYVIRPMTEDDTFAVETSMEGIHYDAEKEDVTLVSIKDENGGEYHSDKAGTYKLTGTLQTKEGITIPEEFRKVTVNVTVEEKGKVPPTSGKEEGKNNSGAVQTGDDKNVWLPIAGLVAAIAVVAAVLIIKNKKKK